MRVLHTSDWHLGRRLFDRDRDAVYEQFLAWLLATVKEEKVDLLIVAGDIFDTAIPTTRAEKLYFDFLAKLSLSGCRHAVAIGGNHDSASQLNAPRSLLGPLGVHVVGGALDPAEEVIELRRPDGTLEGIVCAVPYLRERDFVRIKTDTLKTRDEEIAESIRSHYERVVKSGIERMGHERVPLIATGHLMTCGIKPGEDENELYIGSLGAISSNIFSSEIDYVALGHIHRASVIDQNPTRNYCGSPIAFNFDEAHLKKIVRIADFNGRQVSVRDIEVPKFDELQKISGSQAEILDELMKLCEKGGEVFVQVEHDSEEEPLNLVESVQQTVKGTSVSVLRILNKRGRRGISLGQSVDDTFIDVMNEYSVFKIFLNDRRIPEDRHQALEGAYRFAVNYQPEAAQ